MTTREETVQLDIRTGLRPRQHLARRQAGEQERLLDSRHPRDDVLDGLGVQTLGARQSTSRVLRHRCGFTFEEERLLDGHAEHVEELVLRRTGFVRTPRAATSSCRRRP